MLHKKYVEYELQKYEHPYESQNVKMVLQALQMRTARLQFTVWEIVSVLVEEFSLLMVFLQYAFFCYRAYASSHTQAAEFVNC